MSKRSFAAAFDGFNVTVYVSQNSRSSNCNSSTTTFGSVGMARKTFVLNKPWYVNMWSVGGRVVDSPPASTALTMVDGGWIEYCSELGYSTGDDAILIPDHVYGTAAVWIVWTDYCFFFSGHPPLQFSSYQSTIYPAIHPPNCKSKS